MDGWNTSFLLGCLIFRGDQLVSGSVATEITPANLPVVELACLPFTHSWLFAYKVGPEPSDNNGVTIPINELING